MELLEARDFGKAGLNADLPPWNLPLNYLTYAQNFRIFNNAILGFGGSKKLVDLPADFHAAHILYTTTPTDHFWIMAGNKIYVYDGTLFTEIGSSLPAYGTNDNGWTSCKLGRVPILNNDGYYPLYWNPQLEAQDMQILPYDALGDLWSDKQWSCKAMRSFGPYLVAMNMTETTVNYADTVRWSHPAERNDVPATWDETDPASLAGLNVLGGDAGAIVDGFALRNTFTMYRESGITVLNFSDDSFVFSTRNLTNTVNIANINCIVEVKGTHIIVASNDVVMSSGDSVKSILHQRARTRYSSVFNQNALDQAFALHNTTTKEVWCCIPTGTAQYATEAWVYNYRDDTWSIHDINSPAHAAYGQLDQPSRLWQDWNETWQTATGNWARSGNSAFDANILGVRIDTVSDVQIMDQFTSEVDFTTILERTDYVLTTMQDVNTISRIYPHMKGTQAVQFQVGSQEHAGGPVNWRPQQSFLPGVDRKIDVRVTGELFSFRITVQNNSSFEFSGMDIEYTRAGLR